MEFIREGKQGKPRKWLIGKAMTKMFDLSNTVQETGKYLWQLLL